MVAWVVPFPANCKKGLLGLNPALRTIGFPLATRTASAELNGAALRHPAAPSTPLGHPANFKVVPLATSAFHGGPGGSELGSVLKTIELNVNVTVPPDPVSSFPVTSADAEVASSNTTTAAENAKMAEGTDARCLISLLAARNTSGLGEQWKEWLSLMLAIHVPTHRPDKSMR